MLNSTIVANRRPLCNRDPPRPGAQRRGRRKQKKKDILSDVLLGALEEIRTPDLLIRSQTLYPTELPAQVQDIYYHRHRGLSTVFAKKFEIFFAEQKRFFCPLRSAAEGPFFRLLTALPRRPVSKGAPAGPGDTLRALECPCAVCGVPCALRRPARPGVSLRGLWCPPCALRCLVCSGVGLCALRCPCAHWSVPARSGMPCVLWGGPVRPCGAPCAPWGYPTRSALPCGPPAALRRIAPRNTERASPLPRNNSLPRPAAALCPAPPRTAEKKPGRSKRSGRALFISPSGDEAQVSDQALGLPNWQSLLPESEGHISSMFRGSL